MAVRDNSTASGRGDAEPAPLVEQLGRAFAAVAGLIGNIRADQWSAPTPCPDLAQATGQPADLPDDLAERSLAFARTQLTEQARPGRFGPAQSVAEQAPAIERLAAFLGRPVSPGR
jgi:hypothetical protein